MSGGKGLALSLGGILSLSVAAFLDGLVSLGLAASGVALSLAGIAGLVRERGIGEERTLRATEEAASVERRIRAVEEDRTSLEAILTAMEEGVVLVVGGQVTFANPAATRLAAIPSALAALALPSMRRLADEAARGGGPLTEEIAIGFPQRVVRASAIPVGPSDRVLLVLQDVTEARRVEAMRRDFVADASHELKTPVAAIRASAETLREALREDPAAAEGFAGRLSRDAERLSRIVADLLDLSRLETGQLEREAVRLDRVVHEEVERARDRAKEAGVDLEVDLVGATVRGDRKDLSLLLANLLDNAVRYTGRGGRVRVELTASDGRAILAVADTGVGIPTRDLPRIFERFYRVDRARSRETGGTGLGLSIARHVVERHGGSIRVDSELGRGSTFTVELPRLEEEPAATPSPS